VKPGIVRPGEETDELLQWLRDHGFEPGDVYQVDVGRRSITVHRYERNDGGYVAKDNDGGVATLPPVKVKL